MNKALSLDITAPVGSIESYAHWASQMPILSAEEERDLAVRFHQQGDLKAARLLVMSHLRFVVKIARGYAGYGLAQADLIQEGNIGLMKAVKRFNPEVGVRLVTLALHWIKAEIHDFVLKNWRIVKVATTKAQRKLFFNLRGMKNRLGWLSKDEVDDVAKTLNVKPSDITEMEARLYANDMAFDMGVNDDNEEDTLAPVNFLTDHSNNPELLAENSNFENDNKTRLNVALKQLDQRSQEILSDRWLANKKATLHELAAKYKVSAERIRQLEQQAMQKLRGLLA